MAITLDRKTPGVIGILFGAALSVSLGALLAGLHLASLPVEVVKAPPKEPAEGARYLVLGEPGLNAGKSWTRKSESLAAGGGSVAFSEAELNAWAEHNFEQAKVADDKKNESVMLLSGTPNFRLVDTRLQIGLVNTLNFFGSEFPVVLQARGGFARKGSGWRYAPDELLIGALPLHKIPALMPVVVDRFSAGVAAPADLGKVLAGASEIAVHDGSLSIVMP